MCEPIEEELEHLKERIEALEAGPLQVSLTTLARLDWKPGEMLVVKTGAVLTDQARHRIRECFMRHFTGLAKSEVIFLDPDTDLTVMAPQPREPADLAPPDPCDEVNQDRKGTCAT